MKWLLFCLLLTVPARAREALHHSFWVWHRQQPLAVTEVEKLAAAGVERLCWHVGTVRIGRAAVQWESEPLLRSDLAKSMNVVPVLRGQFADRVVPEDAAPLAAMLRDVAGRCAADSVQLDFDCPDRLLGDYALLLPKLRQAILPVKLSITA